MQLTPYQVLRLAIAAIVCLLWPLPALATQGHAGIEGVWVHQFAHLFFLFSMGLLIYWLRQAGLVRQPGWRYVQYAAVFFIIWNADAILVHFLDEQLMAVSVTYTSPWRVKIASGSYGEWISTLYFIAKLDHLFCVPGMVCMMLGLRHMLRNEQDTSPDGEAKR